MTNLQTTSAVGSAAPPDVRIAAWWPRASAPFGETARWHRRIVAIITVASVVVTMQRGVLARTHTTFKIFRWSYWHLLAGVNLYAPYPAEQGTGAPDLFKYSPTAALLFAPFAAMPYSLALLAWSLVNGLLLYYALTRALPGRRAVIAGLVVLPDLFASLQGCASNGVVAALMVLAFVAAERSHRVRAALAIALGVAIKVFPLAAVALAIFHGRRRRFALVLVVLAIALVLLPLLVTSPGELAQQYRWWLALERSDARDLVFGHSIMRAVRTLTGGSWPNWPFQLGGTALVLLPLAVRRDHWSDERFRLAFLASLLAYVVLFNHQAERQTFVVSSAGVAIWLVSPPTGTIPTPARAALAATALLGLLAPPLFAVWLVMQLELYGWRPGRGGAWYALAAAAPPERTRATVPVPARPPQRPSGGIYLSVIVPVWNGGAALATTLDALASGLEREPFASEIVIVDDGSTDETPALLAARSRDLHLTVLRNAHNRGKGHAVARGMLAARGHIRVFTDADLAYSAADIDAIVTAIEDGNDVAIGCRVLPDSRCLVRPVDFPFLMARHVLSRGFNVVLRHTLVANVLDTQAGLKGFTHDAAEMIFSRITVERFGFDVECLYIAQRHGHRIAQVPVVFRHERSHSTVHVVRDGVRLLGDLAAVRMNAVRGRYD